MIGNAYYDAQARKLLSRPATVVERIGPTAAEFRAAQYREVHKVCTHLLLLSIHLLLLQNHLTLTLKAGPSVDMLGAAGIQLLDATIRPKRLAPGAPLTLDGAPTVCIGEQRILCEVDATVLLKGP